MLGWQKIIVIIWGLFSLALSLKGFYESSAKKNVYGLTPHLFPFGIFVWGDAVIIGFFWSLVSIFIYILKDWYLILLIFCVFWTVRSLGEAFYWLNQQFTSINNKNPIQNLKLSSIFHSDAVWFANQVIWQCASVIFIILTLYTAHLWLNGL